MLKRTKPDEFFHRKRIKKSGCWNFTGATGTGGYGILGFGGKMWVAHRLSWTLTNGEIPEGLLVCHKCDNRKCINPDHLFLGTYKDNTQDMLLKGRRPSKYKINQTQP